MGSSHSKQAKVRYTKGKYDLNKPLPPLPIVRPEVHNCWLAAEAAGRSIHLPEISLHVAKTTHCRLCRRRISAENDFFAWHNMRGCGVSYHSHCMKRYLQQFYVCDGRMAVPRCFHCRQALNIRIVPVTRKNPMGFDRYNGR